MQEPVRRGRGTLPRVGTQCVSVHLWMGVCVSPLLALVTRAVGHSAGVSGWAAGSCPGLEARPRGNTVFNLSAFFPKWPHYLYQISSFSASSSTLTTVCRFCHNHACGHEMVHRSDVFPFIRHVQDCHFIVQSVQIINNMLYTFIPSHAKSWKSCVATQNISVWTTTLRELNGHTWPAIRSRKAQLPAPRTQE